MNLLENLFSTLPLLVLLAATALFNVPRLQRHQQFAVPCIAAGFVLLALVGLYSLHDSIDDLASRTVDALPFLDGFYETAWLYGIQNATIVFGFLVIKWMYRPFAMRTFKGDTFPGHSLAEVAYEYDRSRAHWFVRPPMGQTRSFFKVMYFVSLTLTGVLIMMTNAFPTWPAFTAIAFPALATLVIGEIWHALNGVTRDEAADRFLGTDDDSHRMANYEALRGVLRSTFEDRIIDEGTELSSFRSDAQESYHTLQDLASSDEAEERICAEYFQRMKQAGLRVDENLLHASLNLLHGVSTVINTPFYRDLTPYLALPVYERLLGGGRCLIITGRDGNASEVGEWMTDGLEAITGIPELWDVGVIGRENPDTLEVGVLRAADLHNLTMLSEYESFFRDVETVILVEPSRMLAAGQLGLSLVVSLITRDQQPVFVSVDRGQDGIVDALSHLLKVNLTSVIAMQDMGGTDLDLVWQSEGPHLSTRLFPGVARYLGVGTEISAVALKYDISEVSWVGGEKFPVTDMAWIAGQYYAQISAFAGLKMSQRALGESLVAETNPMGLTQEPRRFLVVEDELHNAYESLRLFASRSTEAGFTNLVSENYLLRDYMVDNREVFAMDGKAIPSFVPDYARTGRNTVLKLLLMLATFDVPCSTIQRELGLVGLAPSNDDIAAAPSNEDAVMSAFEAQVKRYFTVNHLGLQRTSGGFRNNGVDATYRLASGTTLEQMLSELRSAYFLVEDEIEERNYLGGCLRGHIQQTVLPGQFLTLDGKQYEVQSIGDDNFEAEVVLRRAAEHISGRPVYRQLRSFSLTDVVRNSTVSTAVENARVRVDRVYATVTAETHGYLELPSRNDFTETKHVSVSGLEPRNYQSKSALRVSLDGASPRVRRTITLLLNELFVTLFPTAHQLIVALTSDPDNTLGELMPELTNTEDDDAIYIVEDSLVDLGLTIAVERHWNRLFEMLTDYLAWLESEKTEDLDTTPDSVRFPDESDEDIVRREARIADAEQRGSYPVSDTPENQSGVIQRLSRKFFGRPQRDRPAAPVPAAAEGTTLVLTDAPSRTDDEPRGATVDPDESAITADTSQDDISATETPEGSETPQLGDSSAEYAEPDDADDSDGADEADFDAAGQVNETLIDAVDKEPESDHSNGRLSDDVDASSDVDAGELSEASDVSEGDEEGSERDAQ